MRRARESMRPMVCSATARALRPGVLTTMTPCWVAASRSTWLRAARQTPTNWRSAARLEEFFEDEVGFDDEVGGVVIAEAEAEFFRVLQGAGLGPAFVVDGHELLQGGQGGGMEGGQDEGPQFWNFLVRTAWGGVDAASDSSLHG